MKHSYNHANLAVKRMTLAAATLAQIIISNLKLEKELNLIRIISCVIFVKQPIPAFQV